MDIKTVISSLLEKDNVAEISRASGESEENTRSLLTSALPLLLGAQQQPQQQQQSAGLGGALLGSLLGGNQQQVQPLQAAQPQQNSGLNGMLGSALLGSLLGGNQQQAQQQNGAGNILAGLTGLNVTNEQAQQLGQIAEENGVTQQQAANILSSAMPVLLNILSSNTQSQQASSGSGNSGKKDDGLNIGSLLMNLLK